MRNLLAFTGLIARPATFLWGLLAAMLVALVVAGVMEPDVPVVITSDHAFLVCFGYPFVGGTLAGMALREVQHSSFAWTLPGVRWKTAYGFLICGLVLSAIVVGLAVASGAARDPFVLVGISIATYCLGAVAVHPASRWLIFLNILLVVFVIAESGHMARLAHTYALATHTLTTVLTGLCIWQLFSLKVARLMPSIATTPILGSYSLQNSLRIEKRKLVAARSTGMREPPLTDRSVWSWVRAAAYESYGTQPLKEALRVVSRLGLLFVLIVLHSLLEPRSGSLLEMIGKVTYDALLRPPHLDPIGDRPPYVAVLLWIAAIGAGLVFVAPLALRSKVLYPLSRREQARIAYRASLVLSAAFAILMAASFLIVGHLAGWLADYPLRMDFIPFFTRPLLATLVLLPCSQYVSVLALTSDFSRQSDAAVILIAGVIAFIVVVLAWSLALPTALTVTEMTVSAVMLIASQLAYHRALIRRYATADLI